MKKSIGIAVLLCLLLVLPSAVSVRAQEEGRGGIDWVGGVVTAVGTGTSSKPSMGQARALARRAAMVDAQRNLLEIIKGVKVDSETTVENFVVTRDVIKTNVSGLVKGARLVKQAVERQPDGSMLATVEMRICLNPCPESTSSLVQALDLEKKKDEKPIPPPLPETVTAPPPPPPEAPPPPNPARVYPYDRTKPVTGVVFSLEGRMFERVIMPVVVTAGEDKALFTVYSAKSVKPVVVRTYGVVRYADTVDQALKNQYLGGNIMVIPAADITADKMILIKIGNAKTIEESTRYGNDYLGDAKVVIAAD